MADSSNIHKRTFTMENVVPSMSNQLNYFHGFEEENDGFLPITQSDSKINSKSLPVKKTKRLRKVDRPAFFVLIILYLLQGIPVGLAFGSIPFILKSKLSYSQVGVFSLAAYPYSLKLLWSPIVDAIYSPKLGRRKSWIIPIQLISGTTLILLGSEIDTLLQNPQKHLTTITGYFFLLVFFCATQDIAVDGWALTVLSPDSLSFASTAQTIGINSGYFSSFTVFLALSSPDFANKYLRETPIDEGLFTLGQYLYFWGWVYLIVTGFLYFVPENPKHLAAHNESMLINEKVKAETIYNQPPNSRWRDLKGVYYSMYQVLKLPNVQVFVVILLLAKVGFQVNESATNLKLVEKGLSKEDLSITVLIDFPFEMVFGYYAGRWSNGKSPLKPWIIGFCGKLVAAVLAQVLVFFFPTNGKVTSGYFLMVILQHLLTSFMSTISFVSLCAFHTKIADPVIGGTYMTTLNTLSNYGGTWPKLIIYYLIDKLSLMRCDGPIGPSYLITSEESKQQCKDSGGDILTLRDGYYYTNALCVTLGFFILLWIKRKTTYLQSLPSSAWRVSKDL